MTSKKSEIQHLLEHAFPEKTPQAIQIMLRGYEKIKRELIKKLEWRKVSPEIIKMIEEFE